VDISLGFTIETSQSKIPAFRKYLENIILEGLEKFDEV